MGMLKSLKSAVVGVATVVSDTTEAAKGSLSLLNNTITDSIEQQSYEREQSKVLSRLEADINFAREYKLQMYKLKSLGLSRAQIKLILEKNIPKTSDISVDDLLND